MGSDVIKVGAVAMSHYVSWCFRPYLKLQLQNVITIKLIILPTHVLLREVGVMF